MTTRRKVDRQQIPATVDGASDDNSACGSGLRARAPEPADLEQTGADPAPPTGSLPNHPRSTSDDASRSAVHTATASSTRCDDNHLQQPGAAQAEAFDDNGAADSDSDQQGLYRSLEGAAGSNTADGQSTTAERTGVDARRRGWFWHWNNVVTQYAPLIGLKGVGLLNSYTVWTDRRDESPHRGYAFPSQQSEADFYGEERAELITINKILVALDLIEIRKEMLTRVDGRGRRWRVPHNLYRVKDRPDGVDLRAADVLRVAKLAKTDASVFRYVRRVFSERFRPIDGDNVWQTILTELRHDPTWRELQERTRAIEARASARTRAGHQSRTSAGSAKSRSDRTSVPPTGTEFESDNTSSDTELLPDIQRIDAPATPRATDVEQTNTGSRLAQQSDVDPANDGLAIDVAGTNTASGAFTPTSVAAGSNGQRSVVGPGNTTYDQTDLTTTTTTSLPKSRRVSGVPDQVLSGTNQRAAASNVDRAFGAEAAAGTDEGVGHDRGRRVASGRLAVGQRMEDQIEGERDERQSAVSRTGSSAGERRLADPNGAGPVVDPGPLVISTFEAANDRRATPLERHLLAELERDADPAARAVGSTGASWVIAAMREAVSSGSAFVAPKRIREIIARWSANPRNAPSAAPPVALTTDDASGLATTALDGVIADVRLPGGASSDSIWNLTLDDLARALDQDAFERLLAGSRITRYWRGTVEIAVNSGAADKLSNEYRGLVERHLNSHLPRPVAVRFQAHSATPSTCNPPPELNEQPVAGTLQPLLIAESEVEIGRQVWQTLLGDLARLVSPVDLERLAGVVVLGQDEAGAILLGTPSPLARRLIDSRYRSAVETSMAALLGQPASIRTLDAADWRLATRD